jgi:hypothetical protein
MNDFQTVLPKRVVQQPRPRIFKGGDCGACVLAGLVGFTVEEIYTEIYEQEIDSVQAPSWLCMIKYLTKLYYDKELDRLITDVPFWPSSNAQRTFGDGFVRQGYEWFKYVIMALDAGYYGIMNYSMAGGGPYSSPDHYVLLCGARSKSRKIKGKSGWKTENQLLISCSSRKTSKNAFWIELSKLSRDHGGFNIILARPKT